MVMSIRLFMFFGCLDFYYPPHLFADSCDYIGVISMIFRIFFVSQKSEGKDWAGKIKFFRLTGACFITVGSLSNLKSEEPMYFVC